MIAEDKTGTTLIVHYEMVDTDLNSFSILQSMS